MLEFGGRAVDELAAGYQCSVDPATGMAMLRLPVRAPIGRGGLGPAFELVYSSGAGNSPFGSGWNLSGLLTAGLDTSRHLPRWDDTDGYQLGTSEIVPWTGVNDEPRGFVDSGWSVAFYRSRIGDSQRRIEKWVRRSDGRVHFRMRDARNVVTIFGARSGSAARISDPSDDRRTYLWLPELQLDPFGNAMWLEYAAETFDGVDHSASYERHRGASAQRYLKRVCYGNATPITLDDNLLAGTPPAGLRWSFQLVFDYGDHADPDRPSAVPDRTWPARQDPFSDCRAGFDVRTWRLCRRILSFHDFDELGPGPTLAGALVLRHDEDPAGSTLREITTVGHRRDGEMRAIPPLRMTYAQPAAGTAFLAPSAETQKNLPVGVARRNVFLDLAGDGLPGILSESDRAWYYKPNEGGGVFGAQTLVLDRPATRPGAWAFGDVDRDGDVDLSQLAGRLAGLYEHDRQEGRWQGFRPFPSLPHVEGLRRHAQWIDLNGDGRPDVIIAKGNRVTWFPSDGDDFAAPVEIAVPDSPHAAPSLQEDPSLDLFFADMNGDGLADLVRVQNGRVEYWPSLGNGRFGDATLFEDSPRFAASDEFDAGRLRFIDFDGSGTTDLVYLGRGEITIWINAAGNRLVPGPHFRSVPYLDNVSDVAILDFLGDGRPCLVWSSPLPGRDSALHYLPLAGADRARLLLAVDDSRGGETRFTYSSSAAHYLRDKRSGQPWTTRLPQHVTVVDRREVFDHIGGTSSVQRLEYRDGFFDGAERKFRGFGRVNVYDADPGGFGAPSLTRIWTHRGTAVERASAGAYALDPQLPLLPPHVIEDTGLSNEEVAQACRALAGRVVRTERFAVDAQGHAGLHPFSVEQTGYRVRRLQPPRRGNRAAFSVVTEESLSAQYEQLAADPRVTHEMTVDIDAYGFVLADAEIGYPRRTGVPRDAAAQDETQVVMHRHAFVHFDTDDRFELGIPTDTREYEILGVAAGADGRITRARLRQTDVATALAAPLHHHQPAGGGVEARLQSWEQSFYWNDARDAELPHGDVGARTLVHHEEAAVFAPSLVAEVYGARVDDARLTALGYVERDGLWWQRDETHVFGDATLFFQRQAVIATDGGRMELEYDAYALELIAVTDAAGNRAEAVIDYHVVAPRRITDPNGNVSEVRYDALGVIVAASSRGELQGQPWGFDVLDDLVFPSAADAADVLADPAGFLQGAARFIWYDFDAWLSSGAPPVVVTLVAEELPNDGAGGGAPRGRIDVAVAYLDGMGRALQAKSRVEAGDAIQRDTGGAVLVDGGGRPVLAAATERWLVSGHVVFDNKQQPLREYEPYFSNTLAYERDAVLREFGVATLRSYDALGRETGQFFPNGTFARIAYAPWSIERSDPNDTVMTSAYRAPREARPAGDPERQALEHAKTHADTPLVVFLDAVGRQIATVARGGSTADDRRTETHLDAKGDPIAIIDPRGLTAFRYRRDMEGRPLFTASIDAGETRALHDARGRLVHAWDAADVSVEHAYDLLGRPTTTHVRGGSLDHRVEERIYGESLPDGAARNARGLAAGIRDEAGEIAIDRYDPAGRVLSSTRRLRTATDDQPDWRSAVALDAESFTTTSVYDAMGRLREATLPDGTTRRLVYLRGGGVARQSVSTAGGEIVDADVIRDAAYDARGQRSRLLFGNGVALEYRYDAETFRLARQIATKAARTYQDIALTYDPAGNIVRLTDGAQDGPAPLIQGVAVTARRDYAYDAHYRLVRASGRVHQALLQHDYIPAIGGALKGTRHITLANGAAIERFTRTYEYDRASNLTRIRHQGDTQNWTTDLWVSLSSNRSLPALDPNGVAVVNSESKFDTAGRMIELDHLRRIDWSWRGTLSRAVVIERTGGTDDDEVYAYDADAQRLRKVATRVEAGVIEVTENVDFGDCERKRVRRNGVLVLERWTSHFRDDDGERIALLHRWVIDDLARETDTPAQPRFRYQLTTHQGSSALELDGDGEVVSYEEYFPYGGSSFMAADSARDVNLKEYRYTGKARDDATSLYYFGYRYYAPWIGRWISPDPIGPQDDLNLYQFVLGDPIGNVDEDGLQTTTAPGKVYEYSVPALPAWAQPVYDQMDAAQREQWARHELVIQKQDEGARVITRAEWEAYRDAKLRAGKNVVRYLLDKTAPELKDTTGPGGGAPVPAESPLPAGENPDEANPPEQSPPPETGSGTGGGEDEKETEETPEDTNDGPSGPPPAPPDSGTGTSDSTRQTNSGNGRQTISNGSTDSGTGTRTGGGTDPNLRESQTDPPAPPGLKENGTDANGALDGGRTAARDGDQGTAGHPGGTDASSSGTSPTSSPSSGETILDTVTRWAGYANFEFESGGPEGQSGGVPGGQGKINLGWGGQLAYIALTILSWVGPGAILKGLRLGFKFLAQLVRASIRTLSLAARKAGVTVARFFGRLFTRRARPPVETVTLYRGVNQSHAHFATQSRGIVRPNRRWWQFWKRPSSALEHNKGGTRNSPYTSWTTDPRVAENLALRPGNTSGIVIKAEVPISRTVVSPNLKDGVLIQTGEFVTEAEVLVRGVIRGKPMRVKP